MEDNASRRINSDPVMRNLNTMFDELCVGIDVNASTRLNYLKREFKNHLKENAAQIEPHD